ncbi:MAG TPA: hypothetical protein VFF21_00445 [Flavobacteriaceae bacterium]|nr:hypothetical protein [Flavobacteriaceae bacterium]
MKKLFRVLLAGWGANKIAGGRCGCIGTFIVFLILFWLLGYVFEVF